ncbi:MAG: AMIN domain-containing protein [Leptolyngbyaceae cyanobacterium SM1_4_3]|nr:AMIN domain-containing protein [Leptolyngbyaceae cyanobacterium SM1_4_3]
MGKARFVRVGFSLGLATLTAVSNPFLRLSLIGIGAIAIPSIAPAEAATLTNWQFDPDTRELQVTVPEGTTPRYFLLAEPPRIVLDLPNTQLGTVPEQQTFNGTVRQIRVGQFQPGLTRIVIELAANAEFAPGQVELRQDGDRWVLRPLLTDAAATPDVATAPAQPVPVQPPIPEVETPEVETPETETAEATPETTSPETTAIAPPLASSPETTAAELDNDLPQLSPAPLAPDISPDIDVPNVSEAVSNADLEVSPDNTAADISSDLPSAIAPAVPSTDLPSTDLSSTDLPSADLPPLEPDALEIPVEPASEVPETLELLPSLAEPASEPVTEQVELEEGESDLSTEPSEGLAVDDVALELDVQAAQENEDEEAVESEDEAIAIEPEAQQPEAIAPLSQTPTALPPATFSTSPSVTVTVPPLGESPRITVADTPDNAPAAPIPQPSQPAALPPATFSPSQTGQVSVPPVSTIPDPTAAAPLPPPASVAIAPSQDNLSEDDLPGNASPGSSFDQNLAVAPTPPDVLLPSGTVLSLRYPGETSLSLESGVPRQEVLLLDQPVRDRNGNLIVEAGSQVIGRFETGSQGSRFIVQAIALQGQNVLMEAESGTLAGDREVSENSLIQNSALGALALTVLGGFTGIGLLGGLAAGATATYLTAPQPAIIQPNQIVEVRLTEDLPRP